MKSWSELKPVRLYLTFWRMRNVNTSMLCYIHINSDNVHLNFGSRESWACIKHSNKVKWATSFSFYIPRWWWDFTQTRGFTELCIWPKTHFFSRFMQSECTINQNVAAHCWHECNLYSSFFPLAKHLKIDDLLQSSIDRHEEYSPVVDVVIALLSLFSGKFCIVHSSVNRIIAHFLHNVTGISRKMPHAWRSNRPYHIYCAKPL